MFKDWLNKNVLSLTIWIVGLVMLFIGAWQNSQVSAYALAQRVDAIERRNTKTDPLIERFYTVEADGKNMAKTLEDIKASQLRVEQKVDRLYEKVYTKSNDD